MRTSAGLREIGLSGKMRIQIRPPRLIWRVMARRAASIWRAVRRPRPTAFRPYSPKLTLAPRVATPVLRPFCSLRYFLLAGCSIPGSSSCLPLRLRRWRHHRLLAAAEHFALEYPHLDADHSVIGLGLGKSVVDVGTQGMERHAHELLQFGAQMFDVLALLADHHTGTGAVYGDFGVFRRTLDHHFADRGVRQFLLQEVANLDVLLQHRREILGVRVPARRPVALHRQPEPGRVNFLSHA